MLNDMFSGKKEIDTFDGRCAFCPFRTETDCKETEQDVSWYLNNGYVNKTCPYRTKDEL